MSSFSVTVSVEPFGDRYQATVSAPVEGIDELLMGVATKATARLAVAAAWDQARQDVVDELCPHPRAKETQCPDTNK